MQQQPGEEDSSIRVGLWSCFLVVAVSAIGIEWSNDCVYSAIFTAGFCFECLLVNTEMVAVMASTKEHAATMLWCVFFFVFGVIVVAAAFIHHPLTMIDGIGSFVIVLTMMAMSGWTGVFSIDQGGECSRYFGVSLLSLGGIAVPVAYWTAPQFADLLLICVVPVIVGLLQLIAAPRGLNLTAFEMKNLSGLLFAALTVIVLIHYLPLKERQPLDVTEPTKGAFGDCFYVATPTTFRVSFADGQSFDCDEPYLVSPAWSFDLAPLRRPMDPVTKSRLVDPLSSVPAGKFPPLSALELVSNGTHLLLVLVQADRFDTSTAVAVFDQMDRICMCGTCYTRPLVLLDNPRVRFSQVPDSWARITLDGVDLDYCAGQVVRAVPRSFLSKISAMNPMFPVLSFFGLVYLAAKRVYMIKDSNGYASCWADFRQRFFPG